MLDLVFRNSTSFQRYRKSFFEALITRTLAVAGISDPIEVSVTLVSAPRIRLLNKQYRSKDTPTDVLSFPLGESPVPGYTKRILGDIFICPSYAVARARKERVSLDEKFAWMTVHGTLHLLGYDHERSSREAKIMERLEKAVLRS